MDHLFGLGGAVQRDPRIVAQTNHGIAPQMIGKNFLAVDRDSTKGITFEEPKMAKLGVADARRIFQHGLEHRLQIARR